MTNDKSIFDGKKAAESDHVKKLIAGFQSGDASAFGEIAERYKGLVAKFARQFCDGSSSAFFDDLYQEGLLALYRASCSYNPDIASFSAYASKCIRNSMISWAKENLSERRSDISIDDVSETAFPEFTLVGPEEVYLSKLFCAELKKRAIRILSNYERCVFLLYLEEMTPAETAECLGKSRKSVENALSRIKSKLSRS